MIGHRCKKCLWFDVVHPRLKDVPEIPGITEPGFCRKHKPGAYRVAAYYIGVQPVMDAEEFCGEYKEDKGGG